MPREDASRAAAFSPSVSPSFPTEEVLRGWLDAVGREDEGAMAELYDATSKLVFSLALRILGDRQLAEEATLDVFHQVWRRPVEYTPERGTVKTWLLILARGRALDRKRWARTRTRYEAALVDGDQEALLDMADPGAGPQAVPEIRETRGQVQTALDVLTPSQRTVIELAYFSQLTHREIAQRLEVPLGTVKTHIRRGLLRLRSRLDAQEVSP